MVPEPAVESRYTVVQGTPEKIPWDSKTWLGLAIQITILSGCFTTLTGWLAFYKVFIYLFACTGLISMQDLIPRLGSSSGLCTGEHRVLATGNHQEHL